MFPHYSFKHQVILYSLGLYNLYKLFCLSPIIAHCQDDGVETLFFYCLSILYERE